MYKLAIKSQVWVELQNMVDFYERKNIGLGERFSNDFENTVLKLSTNPFAYFNLKNNKRRISFKTFQSMLIYEIKDDIIIVLSLKDLRSRPRKDS